MNRSYEYDVVVVGGGTAGVAAAVAAAKSGARTLLVERNPYLGGEATNSGVAAFCGFFTCGGNPVKVVAGIGDLVLEEMEKLGSNTFNYIISASGNKNINFQPEYLKCALDNLMDAEGAEYLLHTTLVGADVHDGRIQSLQCADDEGLFTVKAACFIDATGDANLAHLAGAETVWGDGEGNVQAATLTLRLSSVDTSKPMTPDAVAEAIAKGKEAGIAHLTREKGFLQVRDESGIVVALLPTVMPKGLNGKELTELEKDARKQALAYAETFKRFMPGMENSEVAIMGPSIGFRETRRLIGRETVTAEDVLERRKCDGGVARGGWKPEIHKNITKMGEYMDVEQGSYFDIPLGALQSVNIENLYGAGRVVSSDSIGFAAVRVMGTCFATGHAAGVAAALQAAKGVADIQEVRTELEKQGAMI
ncbi:MAG: FAD-dependent oxidoreductase [Eubacteriales bacterium]|nr:FAD-dependent oxidoreductase [Eubacteriales bacterium]